MILALGNWVLALGHFCRYWVSLLLADIFFHCDTQYDTDQTAVGTVHIITILASLVRRLSADDVREWGGDRVQAIHRHHSFEVLCGRVLYIFHFNINTSLCYTVVSVLGIGIAIGQYYWILDALFGIVLTLVTQ